MDVVDDFQFGRISFVDFGSLNVLGKTYLLGLVKCSPSDTALRDRSFCLNRFRFHFLLGNTF